MLNDDKEISNVEQFDVSYDEVIFFIFYFFHARYIQMTGHGYTIQQQQQHGG